jgi:Na+-driven multidrug efflux pump
METPNRTKSYYKWAFSNELAIGSFVIGTLLLLVHNAIPNNWKVIEIGAYYLQYAIAINTIMLLYLIFLCIILPDERKKTALKITFLLCNIPISLLYFFYFV